MLRRRSRRSIPCGWFLALTLVAAMFAPPVASAEHEPERYWWSGSMSIEIHREDTRTNDYDGTSVTTTTDWSISGQLESPEPHPRQAWAGDSGHTTSVFTASSVTGSIYSPSSRISEGTYSCSSHTQANGVGTPPYVDVLLELHAYGDPANPPALIAPAYDPSDELSRALGFDGVSTSQCPGGEPNTSEYDGGIASYDLLECQQPGDAISSVPALLPEPVMNADGTVTISGSSHMNCSGPINDGERVGRQTYTVDLTGTPYPPRPPDPRALTVVVHGTHHGKVVGAQTISCGLGDDRCSAALTKGSEVRLAALTGDAGRFIEWSGCDEATGQSCLLTLDSDRTVHAWFGYDFVGQWEPPADGLFDLDRKAEIAGNGAKSAFTGATGCGLSAGALATVPLGGGLIVAGAGGVATRWSALMQKAVEETVGNCATGLAGTIFNGVLLKIDPPDPDWRRVALADRFPRAKAPRCRLGKACAAVTRALRKRLAADARVLELQEALAVTANRYGNAVNANDEQIQAQHQATMRATSGLLADAYTTRNRSSAALARALRAAGIRSVTIPKNVVAKSLRAARRPRAVPKAVVARLLRKHLIVHKREVAVALRTSARGRAKKIDVLQALKRPVATRQMRAAAGELTLADVARLLEAILRDNDTPKEVRERYTGQLDLALRCDDGSRTALRALTVAITGRNGLPGEAGLLLAAAVREVATHDLRRDEACQ